MPVAGAVEDMRRRGAAVVQSADVLRNAGVCATVAPPTAAPSAGDVTAGGAVGGGEGANTTARDAAIFVLAVALAGAVAIIFVLRRRLQQPQYQLGHSLNMLAAHEQLIQRQQGGTQL